MTFTLENVGSFTTLAHVIPFAPTDFMGAEQLLKEGWSFTLNRKTADFSHDWLSLA
jgi:hypothetical protein